MLLINLKNNKLNKINKKIFFVFISFLISGCKKIDEKIDNISGIVFLIFIFFYFTKPLIAKIVTSEKYIVYYKKYIKNIFCLINYVVIPLYITSVLFILHGILCMFFGEVGEKASFFAGILIFLLALEIGKLKNTINLDQQKKIYDNINTIIVFLASVLSLLFMARQQNLWLYSGSGKSPRV